MHHETDVIFPAGTPSIARSYDENGNMLSTSRGGAVWSYLYDALDALTQETLAIDGYSFVLGHGRTLNGDVTTRSNSASGVNLSFDANAYGQPRRVRAGTTDYVANVLYHENGLLEDADYANGRHLSQSLNARKKPDVLKTGKPGATGVSAVADLCL